MNNALEINDLLFKWKNKEEFKLKIKKLEVENKKKIIVYGKRGSGKSTLLNLISGILSPIRGIININSTEINKLSQKKKDEFRANNIGVIFQQFNILDYISPLQNILLPCFFTQFKKYDKQYFYYRAFNLAHKIDKQNFQFKK